MLCDLWSWVNPEVTSGSVSPVIGSPKAPVLKPTPELFLSVAHYSSEANTWSYHKARHLDSSTLTFDQNLPY